jgi:hypothetical protein
MDDDQCSPIDRESPDPLAECGEKERPRFRESLSPQMRKWLTATARVHARLRTVVVLFAQPHKAGGQSSLGDNYVERLRREDKTLLFDALNKAVIEVTAVRDEVSTAMGRAAPTSAPPGSHEKVSEMAARFDKGEWLFVDGDAKIVER